MLALSWALWLGGMIVLLIFVIQLFHASQKVAVDAAPVLFRTFAVYQLIVGMVACASGTLLALLSRRSVHAVLTLLMLVALAGALLIRGWTFEMQRIRLAGESGGPRFKLLHGRSTVAYATLAGLLLIAGVGWVVTSSSRETDRKTGRA
jgi:hypothetical protein